VDVHRPGRSAPANKEGYWNFGPLETQACAEQQEARQRRKTIERDLFSLRKRHLTGFLVTKTGTARIARAREQRTRSKIERVASVVVVAAIRISSRRPRRQHLHR
jgi:hypothetical protein